MTSWSGHGSIYQKRERMRRVAERSDSVQLPTLDEIFNSGKTLEDDFANDLVEKIQFCRFPGSKRSGGSAVRAFLTSDTNVKVLKRNGTIGALVNTLLQVDIKAECDSKHIENTVQSLHILTKDDAVAVQRFAHNPHAIPLVMKLCKYTHEGTQSMSFDILEWISNVQGGISMLIEHNIMEFLFISELLHSQRALTRVKHGAVHLILRLTNLNPLSFLHKKFECVLLDATMSVRRVDAYMEVHLLSAMLAFLNALKVKNQMLEEFFELMPYFLLKIIDEKFEDLDHLNQLVKLTTIITSYPRHVEYLLHHDLMVALQYLVRTDFELFRNRASNDPVSQAKTIERQRRYNSVFTDKRSLPTLMALSTVKSQETDGGHKSDEFNFSMCAMAIEMYENIIEVKQEVIVGIVSSGLIPALLFRVGSGIDLDIRVNKMVVRFLHKLLLKVTFGQYQHNRKINLCNMLTKPQKYARGVLKDADKDKRKVKILVEQSKLLNVELDKLTETHDLRMITTTMRAQGVVALFINSIKREKEDALIREAILALSCFKFSCIRDDIYDSDTIGRICYLTIMRQECYYPGLSIICEAINDPDVQKEYLGVIMESHAVEILVGALRLSGWQFTMKEEVYKALANLSSLPPFYEKLQMIASGISTLVYEIKLHKGAERSTRRQRALNDEEDDGTEMLLLTMKKDLSATRIQAVARGRIGSKIVRAKRKEKEIQEEEARKKREEHAASKAKKKKKTSS